VQDEDSPRVCGHLGKQGGVDCGHPGGKDVDRDTAVQGVGGQLAEELGAVLEVRGSAAFGQVHPIYGIYWDIPGALQWCHPDTMDDGCVEQVLGRCVLSSC